VPTNLTLYVDASRSIVGDSGAVQTIQFGVRPATTDEIIAAIECADMEIDLEARGANAHGVTGSYYVYYDRRQDVYEVFCQPYTDNNYRELVGAFDAAERVTDAMNQHNRRKFFEIVNAWSKR